MATQTAVRFPSVQWFEALNDVARNREFYTSRRNGACDTVMAIKSGDDIIKLTWEAFDLPRAEVATEADLESVDFYLEIEPAEWQSMLQSIKEKGRAEGHQTLNAIDSNLPDGFAKSSGHYHDGDSRDAFYRFNQTFQDYFDASAELQTQFD